MTTILDHGQKGIPPHDASYSVQESTVYLWPLAQWDSPIAPGAVAVVDLIVPFVHGASAACADLAGRFTEVLVDDSLVHNWIASAFLQGRQDDSAPAIEYEVIAGAQPRRNPRTLVGVVRREEWQWRGLAISDDDLEAIEPDFE